MLHFTKSLLEGYNDLIQFLDKNTKLKIYFLEQDKTIFYSTVIKLSNLKNTISLPNVEFYLIKIENHIKLNKIINLQNLSLYEIFFQIYPENKYALYSEILNDTDLKQIIDLIRKNARLDIEIKEISKILTKDIKNEKNKHFFIKFENSKIGKEFNFNFNSPLSKSHFNSSIRTELIKILYHRFLYEIFLKNNQDPSKNMLNNFFKLVTFISRPIEYICDKDIKDILKLDFSSISDIQNQNFSYLKDMIILKKDFLIELAKLKICDYKKQKQNLNTDALSKSSEFNDIKNFYSEYLNDKYGNNYSYKLLKLISDFSKIKKTAPLFFQETFKKYDDDIKDFCFNDLTRVGVYYRYLIKNFFYEISKDYKEYKLFSGERVPSLEKLETIFEKIKISNDKKNKIRLLHFKIEEFKNFYYYKMQNLEILKKRFFEEKEINSFSIDNSWYLENHKIVNLDYYDESIEIPKEGCYYIIFKGEDRYFGKYLKSIIIKNKNEMLLFSIDNTIVNFYRNEIEIYSIKVIKLFYEEEKNLICNQPSTMLL